MNAYELGSVFGGAIVFVLGYLLGRRHAFQETCIAWQKLIGSLSEGERGLVRSFIEKARERFGIDL